jgi:outer membrane receptor for ferrienterochelin and colicin
MSDRQNRFFRRFFIVAACALIALTPATFAQVTTGSLTGSVMAADGSALPGVTIEAVHVPTGTRYSDVTGGNGRFTIPNVRVGGPYRVTAVLEGFRDAVTESVTVPLGSAADVPLTLQLATVSEAITVTATTDDIINPSRTGATSAVSEEQLETLPTVNRTLQDFARTNPYVNVDPQDFSATRMTVAGKNNRYNSISIDGAVNNDLFGLADTGTPGGQADALAISLDAIQEIQVAVSPYDVRQGGFTGGGINAITRSGTNDFEGSVFYSKRDPSFVGEGPFEQEVSQFDAEQYGGRLGGRILRDRLFFFINGESSDRAEQDDYTGDGSIPGSSYRNPADLVTVRNFLIEQFDYDPGDLGDLPRTKSSENLFGRVDWNVNNSNQFTIRHNYVEASNDVIQDRNTTRFRFPLSTYFFADETNSTVAQLNSTFGGSAFNEARVNFTTIRDARTTPGLFPGIEIGGTGPRAADIIAGAEQFSTANSLDQDILEITDDFTFLKGNHTFTLGTHNELFEFANVFMSSAFGHYYFPTIADFLAVNPSRYFFTYNEGGVNPGEFQVNQYGLYASDQWIVRPNLTLTFGLRADMTEYPDSPAFNPIIQNATGFNSSATPDDSPTFSPRFGFNWQIGETSQLRGGVGVFAGRTPYVWVSNAYAGTGIGQISIECSKPACTPTFVEDPFNQPTNFPSGGAAFAASITDPDFKAPRLWRTTLGYDRMLPFGINGTVEVLYSKTIEDVYYNNVNYDETGVSPLDGRPRYTRRANNGVTNAFLLTNTDLGDQLMGSIQLNKRFGNLFTLATSYAHQDANSAFDGGSSTASSNWGFHHTKGDIYEPELSRSAYETTHRFNLSGTVDFQTGFLSHAIGLYYNVQSGRPYSLMFGTDINGDGSSTNDLLFVPENVILCPATATGVSAAGPCTRVSGGTTTQVTPLDSGIFYDFLRTAGIDDRGRILDRYELTEPWTRQMDLHYDLGLPAFAGVRTMLTADVTNILAILDKDNGNVRFVANQNYTPVTFLGIDPTTQTPVYRERAAGSVDPNEQFTTATDRSRWQARLGVRVSF